MRLLQLKTGDVRRLAVVDEPALRLIHGFDSVYALAQEAIRICKTLTSLIEDHLTKDTFEYDPIYEGRAEWKILPPIDHPQEPGRCLVSGTGLTHFGSARERDSMHGGSSEQELTDSMKMFRWGVETGRPEPFSIGVAPEWFYKGNCLMVRAHGDPLLIPPYAEDGGEEAEIAAIYVIGPKGRPYRIGMAAGNEFSDHQFEKKNYLNLAGSKLRTSSLGPELNIEPDFQAVPGKVTIVRNGCEHWSRDIRTGEREMCHSLRNLEHHHFKFALHQRPGDVHIHFLGAHTLSFGHGVRLAHGDVMEVQFKGFGRPLRNPVQVMTEANTLYEVATLV
jgi:hypothetical protein